MRVALHETTVFEPVDESDHRGAVDAEPVGDLLLGQQALLRQEGEHGQLPAVDPVGRQRGAGDGGVAQLHVLEQEAEPRPGESVGRRRFRQAACRCR